MRAVEAVPSRTTMLEGSVEDPSLFTQGAASFVLPIHRQIIRQHTEEVQIPHL